MAKSFHTFYEKCPIVKANKSDQHRRLFIAQIFKKTLVFGLNLLGVSAPDKM